MPKYTQFIKIVQANLDKFKKEYNECPDEGDFTFFGMEFYKGYAKYLIEYVEALEAE